MSVAPGIGVPPLAGLCTYEEAARVGYGVDENVRLLKRYIWLKQRLVQIATLHLNRTPEWEVKEALALHMWLDAEHGTALRARVAEMRHPPHNFEKAPDEATERLMEEALRARSTVELLAGVYGVVRPALLAALEQHVWETNPLVDHPTRRALRLAILEEQEAVAWGTQAIAAVTGTAEARAEADAWRAHLERFLAAAGGVRGDQPAPEELPTLRAAEPYVPDFEPKRDARFESYNFEFAPHAVYLERERSPQERTLALMCKRLLEMDVPEMMARILAETPDEPWEYVADMARQVWDEARHSIMGSVWFEARGVDWTQIPLNVGFSLGLNTLCSATDAHAALYYIEQGLMPAKTGKRYEFETGCESGDPLAALFLDYDWADEVLHVHIGRRWLVARLGSREEALRQGQSAFERTIIERAKELGGEKRGEQRDWWPEFRDRVLPLVG